MFGAFWATFGPKISKKKRNYPPKWSKSTLSFDVAVSSPKNFEKFYG